MSNEQIQNPNDYKVVSFHNSTDFGFTPDMGCMYDGRPINGMSGQPGIAAGETMQLPYHVGHRIAVNLAKQVMVRESSDKQQLDAQGQPIIQSLWNEVRLEALKNTFITELYSEEKPAAMSETDKLMEKVEEYKKMVETLAEKVGEPKQSSGDEEKSSYQDKAEVIAELTKRGIKFDARQNKAALEKLL